MKMLDEFKRTAGDLRIIEGAADREMYSQDIGDLPPVMTKTLFGTLPDFVVQPATVEEIRKVLAFASERKVPVIPRGAASWGFGGVVPTRGGIVIDLSPFRRILALDAAGKTVTVEAGARWGDIDIMARKEGLCLQSYPSSKFSTVGGWISTGGYGINSFKYGHLSKQIVSMKVVTGAGEVRELSPADRDFSYFVGTEGEFGIVVEVTLRLRDVPEGSFPHLLYFPSESDAFAFIGRYAKEVSGAPFAPNVIRFLDQNHLGDVNRIMRSDIFRKSVAVLVELGSAEDERRFGAVPVPGGRHRRGAALRGQLPVERAPVRHEDQAPGAEHPGQRGHHPDRFRGGLHRQGQEDRRPLRRGGLHRLLHHRRAEGAGHVHVPVRFPDQEVLHQHAAGDHDHQGRGDARRPALRPWPVERRLHP